jgi:hypothetical protein
LPDLNSGSINLEAPLQTLKAVPLFDPPLKPSDEEKIRVSVHNYTRALKRNRGIHTKSKFFLSFSLNRHLFDQRFKPRKCVSLFNEFV